MMDPNIQEPTVLPHPTFNPAKDAKRIREALRDPHKEASTIVDILTSRVASQRQEIVTVYNAEFSKDLYQEVKSIYSGKFSKVIRVMLKPTFEYLAKEVKNAMAGLGTDEDLLTEVLCTRSNENVQLIAAAFKSQFGKTIEEELESERKVSAEYKELIGMLISGIRNERQECDPDKARKRAENIYNAERNFWSTETKIFMRLLTHEPYPQLRLIFDEYRNLSGQSMEEAINSEFSGDLKMALLTIVQCAINRSQYYAEKLESAMGRLRFDDHTVIRIIVTRSEIDLGSIKNEYLKIYHKTVYHQIQLGTSGDYRNALLSLLGKP